MIHHRQRLPLRLEARDDLPAVHARLDDLQRDLAADGVGLLRHVDHAHPPAANLFQQFVSANGRTDAVRGRHRLARHIKPNGRGFKNATRALMCEQERLDRTSQLGVACACLFEKRGPLARRAFPQRLGEDGFFVVHGCAPACCDAAGSTEGAVAGGAVTALRQSSRYSLGASLSCIARRNSRAASSRWLSCQ